MICLRAGRWQHIYSYFKKGCRKKCTIPKGIVGDFEFTIFQRNFKEWHERPWTYVCECWKKATKVDSTATVSGKVHWSYPILPFGIVACTVYSTTILEIAVYTNLSTVPMTDPTEGRWKCFLFWLCYTRNGKRCSSATIESPRATLTLLSCLATSRVHPYLDGCHVMHVCHFLKGNLIGFAEVTNSKVQRLHKVHCTVET